MWTPEERRLFRSLKSPPLIQEYLDGLTYNPLDSAFSPRWVMLTGEGHCLEGCLFALAVMEFHGHRPLLVDLLAHNDDHHVIAVYRTRTGWGSLSKSNTTLLSGRQPYYRSVRELVMSYFEFYFNTKGERSLYAYSDPIDLNRYDAWNWRTTDEDLQRLGVSFSEQVHYELAGLEDLKRMPKVAQRVQDACFLGADPAGLYPA